MRRRNSKEADGSTESEQEGRTGEVEKGRAFKRALKLLWLLLQVKQGHVRRF